MATLTVVKFATPEGADQALNTLEDLQRQNIITILDAAVVSWPKGEKKPKTRQQFSPAKAGALSGSFWGLLFGLIFFVPLLGAAIGAAIGAAQGSLVDVGIDDKFIKKTREDAGDAEEARKAAKEAREEARDARHDAGAQTREAWKQSWEQLKETRKERRQKRREEIKEKWGDLTKHPAVRAELKVHAWRLARLTRVRTLAKAAGKDAVVERADKLIAKEKARHDKHMETLKSKGGEE